jgi:hypothetical protein
MAFSKAIIGIANLASSPFLSISKYWVVFDIISEEGAGGEHLEHCHSYQKDDFLANSFYFIIDLYVDQGFFIYSLLGWLRVSKDPAKQLKLSDWFHVQNSAGEKTSVKFSVDDDLVYMIGDGANQYINNNLVESKDCRRHWLS